MNRAGSDFRLTDIQLSGWRRIASKIYVLTGLTLVSVLGLGGAYLYGDRAISNETTRAERFAEIAEIAGAIKTNSLEMRRWQADFLKKPRLEVVNDYHASADQALGHLEDMKALADRGLQQSIQDLERELSAHVTAFESLVSIQEELGFDRSSGLRGALETAAEKIEQYLELLELIDPTNVLLQMRRDEKNFILTGDRTLLERMPQNKQEFIWHMTSAEMPDFMRQEASELMDGYIRDFNAYAEALQRLNENEKQLEEIYLRAEPVIAETVSASQAHRAEAVAGLQDTQGFIGSFVVTAGIVILVLAGFVGLATAGSITRPLNALTEVMKRLAGGDKSVDIPATENRDEIGEMARATLVFRESMVRAEQLTEEQEAERKAKEERAGAIEKLAGSFEGEVQELLRGVSATTNDLQDTGKAMLMTVNRTNEQAAVVSAAAEEATSHARTVAVASEQLSASIDEISRQVGHTASIATSAVKEIQTANETMLALATVVGEIDSVVTMISDIAGQTNLLALNATIEAARAGEAGKGFAVVAGEVKNLASQTARATDDVVTRITAVKDRTSNAVSAIEHVRGVIDEISDISTSIAGAIEEQGTATREIADNISQVARSAQDVSGTMTGVKQAASETDDASGRVQNSAQALAERSGSLGQKVERFLSSVRAA